MKNKAVLIIVPVVLIAAAVVVYFTMFAGGKEPVVEYDIYSPGDPFVTNVKDSNRLLKVGMIIELDSKSMQEELTAKNISIRNTIITVLRSLNEVDVRSDDVMTFLSERLVESLNTLLDTEHITGILYTDFVMQ